MCFYLCSSFLGFVEISGLVFLITYGVSAIVVSSNNVSALVSLSSSSRMPITYMLDCLISALGHQGSVNFFQFFFFNGLHFRWFVELSSSSVIFSFRVFNLMLKCRDCIFQFLYCILLFKNNVYSSAEIPYLFTHNFYIFFIFLNIFKIHILRSKFNMSSVNTFLFSFSFWLWVRLSHLEYIY